MRTSPFLLTVGVQLADDLAFLDLGDRMQRYLEGDESVRASIDAIAMHVPAAMAELETSFDIRDVTGWKFRWLGLNVAG